jgi:hypothetical protein
LSDSLRKLFLGVHSDSFSGQDLSLIVDQFKNNLICFDIYISKKDEQDEKEVISSSDLSCISKLSRLIELEISVPQHWDSKYLKYVSTLENVRSFALCENVLNCDFQLMGQSFTSRIECLNLDGCKITNRELPLLNAFTSLKNLWMCTSSNEFTLSNFCKIVTKFSIGCYAEVWPFCQESIHCVILTKDGWKDSSGFVWCYDYVENYWEDPRSCLDLPSPIGELIFEKEEKENNL